MKQITGITEDPRQKHTLVLDDGTKIEMTIGFKSMMQYWIIESLTYGSFSISGLSIVNSPNMLRQWKNKIPFGLACFSTGNREPSIQNDFSSEASILYILSAEEVQQYEDYLNG